MDPLWNKINEAVHRRETKGLRTLISRYLKSNRHTDAAIYEASEFFRKISDYSSALRILPKELSPEAEPKLKLQTARVLNIVGASHYALRIAGKIRAEKTAKSKVELAEIYHCNCKPREVLEVIGSHYPLPEKEPWHQDWVLHFYYAYSLSKLGRREEAIKHVDGISRITCSELIRTITRIYKGQFLVEAGRPREALPLLTEACRFFSADDRTSDHACAQKWLGIAHLKLGNPTEAKNALEKSFAILHLPSLKAEDWMEGLLWLEKIPGQKENESFACRLHAIGGPDYTPLSEAGAQVPSSEDVIFSISGIESGRMPTHFERSADTAWEGKKPRLGLDYVDELLCYLIYAGEFGLPQFKLYELLWPNEPFSFLQHHKRLARLIHRARRAGFKLRWEDSHLWLLSKDVSATGRASSILRGRSFLDDTADFSRKDVQKYFSTSQTTALELCREWLDRGLIVSSGGGKYKSTVTSPQKNKGCSTAANKSLRL